MTPDQTPNRRRERRASLPELSALRTLIDNARLLRLELAKLAAHEEFLGPASEAVLALGSVSAHLEKICEILAVAKVRKRRRRRSKVNEQPELPNTDVTDI